MKMFNEEITDKKKLLEVIDALDKLNKEYVITKSNRVDPRLSTPIWKYEQPVWNVREASETNQSKRLLLVKSKINLSKEHREKITQHVKEALDNGKVLVFDNHLDYEWVTVPNNPDVELTCSAKEL